MASTFLTVQQYADKKSVHRNLVYAAIADGSIVVNTTHVQGKRFIEWELYKDFVIGDNVTTRSRRALNKARKTIKAELKDEILRELRGEM